MHFALAELKFDRIDGTEVCHRFVIPCTLTMSGRASTMDVLLCPWSLPPVGAVTILDIFPASSPKIRGNCVVAFASGLVSTALLPLKRHHLVGR
jgi:hypothetical protein